MSELSPHEFLHPSGWKAAAGYANGVAARGKLVFLGGHIGWNGQQEFETDDLAGQVRQTLQNILEVLTCAGGRAEHIVRLTWYVTDKKDYLASLREIGSAYRDTLGKHFPAMALVQVVALVEDRAKVEIEATAVIPDEA
ncbi:RidA family protein [Falsigemmobacter faecalis]|uniref:RidA family protein n=1 Tax=Falsigemmobacter faecalis TaxID=2488730 RepID=A0A3P3DUQ5_9RHOB|nr:RidA family protein [Falsigemmobacter faecalis]RRH78027.1 RidA family protein [Falsigemmobacter faecalis]